MKKMRELDEERVPRRCRGCRTRSGKAVYRDASRPRARDDGEAMTAHAARRHDHHRACPAPADPKPPTCSRTSATSSSTTCRRCSSARSPSSRAAPRSRSATRSSSTCAAATSSTTSPPRSTSCAATAPTPACCSSTPSDDVLVRRYEASRRRHPLSDTDRVSDGIARERALLEPLKGEADLIVDTSNLNVHELRDRLRELFADHAVDGALQVNVVSFGYKHGLPLDVDLVFDCRFLPEPALGRRAAPAHRARRRRCATTCSTPAGHRRVPRRSSTACSS